MSNIRQVGDGVRNLRLGEGEEDSSKKTEGTFKEREVVLSEKKEKSGVGQELDFGYEFLNEGSFWERIEALEKKALLSGDVWKKCFKEEKYKNRPLFFRLEDFNKAVKESALALVKECEKAARNLTPKEVEDCFFSYINFFEAKAKELGFISEDAGGFEKKLREAKIGIKKGYDTDDATNWLRVFLMSIQRRFEILARLVLETYPKYGLDVKVLMQIDLDIWMWLIDMFKEAGENLVKLKRKLMSGDDSLKNDLRALGGAMHYDMQFWKQAVPYIANHTLFHWTVKLSKGMTEREALYLEKLGGSKGIIGKDEGGLKSVLKKQGAMVNASDYVLEKLVLQGEVWELMQKHKALKGVRYEDVWKLLIDGKKIEDGGCYAYESTPGFIMGMFSGFKYVLETVNQKMDVAWFAKMRKACVGVVCHDPRDALAFGDRVLRFLRREMVTQESFPDVRVRQNIHMGCIDEAVVVYRSVGLTVYEEGKGLKKEDCWAWVSDKEKNMLYYYPKTQWALQAKCAEIFASYYKEIKAAKNDEEKEAACITLARRIDAYHFYDDANLRMSILVLYRTLLENKLALPLLNNWMDLTFAKDDVFKKSLAEGREAFKKLLGGKLINDDNDE